MTTHHSKISTADVVPDLRERRRQETRLEIERAAIELFERQGSSATTVDEIARRAGVSTSTYFRCFATKEESALNSDPEFEPEMVEWLAATDVRDVSLSGIEAIYQRAIGRVAMASPDAKERALRCRRLLISDIHLRSAAFAAESVALIRVTDRVAAKLGGEDARPYARLMVESAAMATRVAFDTWAGRLDNGIDANLAQVYQFTRENLRQVVQS